MARAKKAIQVTGADEMESIFKSVAPEYAAKLIDQVISSTARIAANELKAATPSDQLKKSIRVKKRRTEKGKPLYDIIFESKKGGFFWRFFEHGTQGSGKNTGLTPKPFVEPLRLNFAGRMDKIMGEQFTKKLASMIKKQAKKQAGG